MIFIAIAIWQICVMSGGGAIRRPSEIAKQMCLEIHIRKPSKIFRAIFRNGAFFEIYLHFLLLLPEMVKSRLFQGIHPMFSANNLV